MKDAIGLLLVGICVSGVAWLFWHFGGKNAFDLILMVLVILLAFDNIRLRRLMRVHD